MEQVRKNPLGKELYKKRKETIERVFVDTKEKHATRYTPPGSGPGNTLDEAL